MKKLVFLLFFLSTTVFGQAQFSPTELQTLQKKQAIEGFMLVGLDIGRVYSLPYKKQSAMDWWLWDRNFPSLSQANWWNIGLNMTMGIGKVAASLDMALVTPFFYQISPICLNFGGILSYQIAQNDKNSLYWGMGMYYQYLQIDFKGNLPFELQTIPVPHDRSYLMQHYLMLTSQINFYHQFNDFLMAGVRVGVNWNALSSDWKYGYYVSSRSSSGRTYSDFRGVSVNILPSAHLSALYVTFVLGFGFVD